MKTLVLGLDNPFLSDDGVDVHVVKALEGRLNQQKVTVMETGITGLNLLGEGKDSAWHCLRTL